VCGAMVRLSHSPIVNVTSGGGETGLFIMEDAVRYRRRSGAKKSQQIAIAAEPAASLSKMIRP
jgi:hypothetical protein